MSIEVEVTGNGKFAGHSTNLESYTVTEEATPIDPADSSGQTGTIQFVATEDPDPDGSILLLNDDIRLTDTKAGETVGKVNTVAVNGIAATATGDSRLAILNATGFVPAYKGDLEGAVLAILGLAGINSGIVIADEVKNISVAHRGGNFNYWLLLKEMCQATGLAEVSLVSGNVVVREIRGREAVTDRIGQLSWGVANVDLAQYVEVKYHNYEQVSNDLVFPHGGWTPETPIYGTSVGAGETQVINIPVNVSLTSIQQPTVQDFVARGYAGPNSVYAVTGSDNLPVLAAQWTAQGGSVTLAIGADGRSIDMTVTGASEAEYAPYQIAVSAGPSDYYSSLRIVGSGLAFDPDLSVRVPTGAPAEKTAQEVGITIDNPWVDTYADAMSAALRAAAGYAAPRQTVNITASVVNRGDNGSYAYPTFADFADQYPADLFSDFDTEWTGQTFADFNAYEFSLVRDDFENQVFGNAAGARLPFRDAMYRIKTANITQDGVVNATAERDTIFSDFDSAQGTATGWEPVGASVTNAYPYPSFELPSGTVTVRTNYYLRPFPDSSGTTGFATSAAGTTLANESVEVDDRPRSVKVTTNGAAAGQGVLAQAGYRPTTGVAGVEVHAARVKAPAGADMRLWLQEYTVSPVAWVANRGTLNFVGTGDWQTVSVSGTKATAGNAMVLVVETRTAQAITFYVTKFFAVVGSTLGDYFDGNTPDAGDFEYVWSGTENASTSIMRAKGILGVSDDGVYQSQEWAAEGTHSAFVPEDKSLTVALANPSTVKVIARDPGQVLLGSTGVEVRRNLTKANAESGSNVGMSGTAIPAVSTDRAHSGTRSFKMTFPGNNVGENFRVMATGVEGSAQTVLHTVSAYVWAPLGATLLVRADERTADDMGLVGSGANSDFVGNDDWQRVSATKVLTNAANHITLRINTRGTAQAIIIYVDDIQHEVGALTDFADGNSLPSADGFPVWAGTENASETIVYSTVTDTATGADETLEVPATGHVALLEGYWDVLTVVEGAYDGPPFSGSTPSDAGPGYAYEWDGDPDESTSTRTELEITSGPATFADFNARFDGYRFEDFALIPLAFADTINPYGG